MGEHSARENGKASLHSHRCTYAQHTLALAIRSLLFAISSFAYHCEDSKIVEILELSGIDSTCRLHLRP